IIRTVRWSYSQRVYGELSLRIQQSLWRCNNPGAFQAHAGARASRSGSPDYRDAEGELVELGKSDHPAGKFNRYGSERALYFGFYPLREIFDLRIFVLTHDLTLAWVSPSFERSWYSLCSLSIL